MFGKKREKKENGKPSWKENHRAFVCTMNGTRELQIENYGSLGDYDEEKWLKFVSGLEEEKEGGARCEKCFRFRLQETAVKAKEQGFDKFGTTLTVSPHKSTLIINKVGKEIEKESGILFLEESFKKKDGYLRSINLSKELSLYRQNYCGCRYSIRREN